MRPALFLDRDGVINYDRNYVYRIEDFKFLPGIFDTVKIAHRLGLKVIVITNQAGIARGYYTEGQFYELTAWMTQCFAAESARIDAVYFCPYYVDGIPPYNIANHPDRKPNPGMLFRAATDHQLDLSRSAIIGDQRSDMDAAERAGAPYRGWFSKNKCDDRTHIPLVDHSAAQAWLCNLYLHLQNGTPRA